MIVAHMPTTRLKFATHVRDDLLKALRALACEEGHQIQTLVEEAIGDLLEKRRNNKTRAHVMNAYQASHARFDRLYEKLAG